MTNNPTIDGVSRAKLEQALRLASVFDDGGDGADAESAQGVAEILRALLDAPAVERQEQCDPPGSFNKHMEYMQENIRLQSTIARLEARVAELESGRGEPVAVMYADGSVLTKAECGTAFEICCKVETPLFAAPPAPVAEPTDLLRRLAYALSQVGKPDNLVDYDAVILAREDLKACLDATAALNAPKAAEWHDVAGDDEGLVS